MIQGKKGGSELPAGELSGSAAKIASAGSLQEIFELVKEVVWKALRVDQAGLLVGLADLGFGRQQALGAFYSPEANTIVINKTIMRKVERLDRKIYNSYCFYILLHEYLHSCGFYDEVENRQVVAAIAANEFGLNHPVTRLSTTNGAMAALLKKSFSLAGGTELDSGEGNLEFIAGIDRANTNYIS